jgi:hypothetical protein
MVRRVWVSLGWSWLFCEFLNVDDVGCMCLLNILSDNNVYWPTLLEYSCKFSLKAATWRIFIVF